MSDESIEKSIGNKFEIISQKSVVTHFVQIWEQGTAESISFLHVVLICERYLEFDHYMQQGHMMPITFQVRDTIAVDTGPRLCSQKVELAI